MVTRLSFSAVFTVQFLSFESSGFLKSWGTPIPNHTHITTANMVEAYDEIVSYILDAK